jgi:hypothetical protein
MRLHSKTVSCHPPNYRRHSPVDTNPHSQRYISLCKVACDFQRNLQGNVLACRLALDVSGGNENGEILMWPENGGNNQKWYFDDGLTIRNKLGFVLGVKNGSADNSAFFRPCLKPGKSTRSSGQCSSKKASLNPVMP